MSDDTQRDVHHPDAPGTEPGEPGETAPAGTGSGAPEAGTGAGAETATPGPNRAAGGAAPPTPPAGSGTSPPPAPPAGGLPAPYAGPAGRQAPYKPSKVTTIAVIDLIDGIVNVLIGIVWVFGMLIFGVGTFGCGCFLVPLAAYPLVLGILEIVYATQLLPTRPVNVGPARWLGVLQILGILYGQVLSVVAGVLKLVFSEDPEVRDYLERTQRRPPAVDPTA